MSHAAISYDRHGHKAKRDRLHAYLATTRSVYSTSMDTGGVPKCADGGPTAGPPDVQARPHMADGAAARPSTTLRDTMTSGGAARPAHLEGSSSLDPPSSDERAMLWQLAYPAAIR